MTSEAFNKGFSALSTVFPGLNLDAKLFWALLNDLDGQFFLSSVWEFIKTTKEVYPGTNIIATIRARVEELKTEAQRDSTLKLEAESEKERINRWQKEATPMPQEYKEELEKLGIILPTPK